MKQRDYYISFFVITSVALLLILVSTFAPGWIGTTYGLFYSCVGRSCSSLSSVSRLTVAAAFMIMAAAATTSAIVLGALGFRGNAEVGSKAWILSTVAAALIVVAVIDFGVKFSISFLRTGNLLYGYSYWLACTAGALNIASAVLGKYMMVTTSYDSLN